MSASDNINARQRRWATLYRGVAGVTPESLDLTKVGSHWTSDPNIAYNYAHGRDVEGYPSEYLDDDSPEQGVVLQAKIHRRHIIDPSSSEGESWQFMHGVLDPGHIERERTVRPNAPVHIEKMDLTTPESNDLRNYPRRLRGRA